MKLGKVFNFKINVVFIIFIALFVFEKCKSAKDNHAFFFENDKISQRVSIVYVKEGVTFNLLFEDKDNANNNLNLQGIAKKNIGTEIDEDENGISYPSQEYIFQNDNIFVAFRIDLETQKRMWVTTTDKRFSYKGMLLLK